MKNLLTFMELFSSHTSNTYKVKEMKKKLCKFWYLMIEDLNFEQIEFYNFVRQIEYSK